MTDARLPERMLSDRRVVRLSDEAFRLYVVTLTWSVANRTDGQVEADDVALIPGRLDAGRAGELCKAGLWQGHGDGWLIADFATTQTTRDELEVLDNARRRERLKKARQRARAAEARDGTQGSPRGLMGGTTQEGQEGQDRQAINGGTNTYGVGECIACERFEPLDSEGFCARCAVEAESA